MFNIDVHIQRIQNGFIVTNNDSSKARRYFPSLQAFVESEMMEAAKEEDRYFSDHDTDDIGFNVRAATSTYIRADDIKQQLGSAALDC